MSREPEIDKLELIAPVLHALKKEHAFIVPEGYFEELKTNIESQVKIHKAGAGNFNIPANYFQHANTAIKSVIALHKQNNVFDDFTVPDNYFADAQKRILKHKVTSNKTFKFLVFKSQRVAMAAALAGVLFSIGLMFYNWQSSQLPKTDIALEQLLYDMDESVIREYVSETKTTVASKEEIEDYILDNLTAQDLTENL